MLANMAIQRNDAYREFRTEHFLRESLLDLFLALFRIVGLFFTQLIHVAALRALNAETPYAVVS